MHVLRSCALRSIRSSSVSVVLLLPASPFRSFSLPLSFSLSLRSCSLRSRLLLRLRMCSSCPWPFTSSVCRECVEDEPDSEPTMPDESSTLLRSRFRASECREEEEEEEEGGGDAAGEEDGMTERERAPGDWNGEEQKYDDSQIGQQNDLLSPIISRHSYQKAIIFCCILVAPFIPQQAY